MLFWAAVADSRAHSIQKLFILHKKVYVFQMIGNTTRNVTGNGFQARHLGNLAMMQKLAASLLSFIDYSS